MSQDRIKNIKKLPPTIDWFKMLEQSKNNIARQFSNRYFEDTDFYWIGEVLSIADEYVNLEDIKYAVENNVAEINLFNYFKKLRNYSLAYYLMGKSARKEKYKKQMEESKERLEQTRENFYKELNKYGKEEDVE